MELTDDQKKTVSEWVAEGDDLSTIQKRISSEFDIAMTYMDVRFLVIDLGLEIQDKESDSPISDDLSLDALQQDAPAQLVDSEGDAVDPGGAGGVSVELDRIKKPGAIISGTVTFSDGVTSQWSLDQMGRLGLSPSDPNYRPTEDDLQAFQSTLQSELKKKGF